MHSKMDYVLNWFIYRAADVELFNKAEKLMLHEKSLEKENKSRRKCGKI